MRTRLDQLRTRLAELQELQDRGIEAGDWDGGYPNAPTLADEIHDIRGQIKAYERLAKLAAAR